MALCFPVSLDMKLINVHLADIPPERERFDTLVSPSGGVATLNQVAHELGFDFAGFDASFPGPNSVEVGLQSEIEDSLSAGEDVALLCTTLIYNAQETLSVTERIKREFGERVKIVLGGQVIPFAREAYMTYEHVDAVCEGDAEVIIPKLGTDIVSGRLKVSYTGWLSDGEQRGKFAFVNYDNYFMLEERMLEQRRVSGFSQLCIQGVGGPGCSWAAGNKFGACDFCALQNITEMNTQPLELQMQTERDLQDKFGPDRFFDVSNQFLPYVSPQKNVGWLNDYIEKRVQYGVTTPKYVYLTVSSINEEVAGLLKEAGVEEAYLGVDHFDMGALQEHNKSHRTQRRLERTLDALKKVGIKVRIGLVVGSAKETESSLKGLTDGVSWLRDNYRELINAVGVFPIYVLPGSKVYNRVKGMPAARDIITRFEKNGFFSIEDEMELSDIYMRDHSNIPVETIKATMEALKQMCSEFSVSYDYRSSPGNNFLKR